jgi:hypothetical protein
MGRRAGSSARTGGFFLAIGNHFLLTRPELLQAAAKVVNFQGHERKE